MREFQNNTNGVLHDLQIYPIVEDMASTLRINATLGGRQADHRDTMVEIEGKVFNTSISILIDLGAC